MDRKNPNYGKRQAPQLPPLAVPTTREEAAEILKRGHYLGPLEYQPVHVFTTPERDAVAVYSHPVASHFKKAAGLGFDALELARLWQDDRQSRPLSQFLSHTLRALRLLAPTADCVFSYTDPAQTNLFGNAHHGGIYRACNFVVFGTARATDHWLTADGEKVSAPAMFRITAKLANGGKASNKGGTKSNARVQELFPGVYTHVPGVPKILYCYPLASTVDACRKVVGGRYAD